MPKPCQTTLKMENPQVSICPQKICGRKSANLPGFKIYLLVWMLVSPLQYLSFSLFLSSPSCTSFTDVNSCSFILWLLLPLTINACSNNFDSSFTFDESVLGLLWSPVPKEEWNTEQLLVPWDMAALARLPRQAPALATWHRSVQLWATCPFSGALLLSAGVLALCLWQVRHGKSLQSI